ncbi:uncharacterized protein LOC135214940 [Macrobrachium nipponense]|uniref:uncharacterized protein LOC135214940 n=1 Tax=Macrobrachium nipponense TaxID=159736 RepID=UPI0030C83392
MRRGREGGSIYKRDFEDSTTTFDHRPRFKHNLFRITNKMTQQSKTVLIFGLIAICQVHLSAAKPYGVGVAAPATYVGVPVAHSSVAVPVVSAAAAGAIGGSQRRRCAPSPQRWLCRWRRRSRQQ